MRSTYRLFFLGLGWAFLFHSFLAAFSLQETPVLYKGRYRPSEAYARLWLYELYHSTTIKKGDLEVFQTKESSPLPFLYSLNFLGSTPFHNAPLFWIGSAEVKQFSHLPLSKNRFSYLELKKVFFENRESSETIVKNLAISLFLNEATSNVPLELPSLLSGLWLQRIGDDIVIVSAPSKSPWPFLKKGSVLTSSLSEKPHLDKKVYEEISKLLLSLKEFEALHPFPSFLERRYQERLTQLQHENVSPTQIEQMLEQEYPLLQRLKNSGMLLKALPSRIKDGEWIALQSLKLKVYHSEFNALAPIENFTLFSDEQFKTIQEAYFVLEKSYVEHSSHEILQKNQERFANALLNGYKALEGVPFKEAHGKQLSYPTLMQLKVETLYVSFPWIPLLIVCYMVSAFLLIISFSLKFSKGYLIALCITALTILLHTGILMMRCYILERPPVSNMFETVLYVPWVATCVSLFFLTRKQPLVLLTACMTSIILLVILEITDLNQNLDQVQAVLDSQFWLMIHVLLVVGSYGIFILGALLGHFYLGLFLAHPKETPQMTILSQIILQTMYGGTLLLVAGTILGGVWAAESWGRFWDWDPKESWAFISCCIYLIWIHAYRFNRIGSFGVAWGAVSGLLAISFTWYGVNYILGTGLHSYGFGAGGENYYYAFLVVESLFLTYTLIHYTQTKRVRNE